MTRIRAAGLAALLCILLPATARADATLFVGALTTPANRLTRGLAIGAGLLVVGVGFEYADTVEDPSVDAPAIRSGTGNLLLQTPVAFMGIQPYFITGAGLYRESLGPHHHTGFALDTGGGVKIALVGPLRLRVDYRIFKLGSGALYSPAHRIYAGVNLKF